MHLDLYTVRVMTLITVLVCSIATLFAWRANSSVTGMRLFALGLLFLSVGSAIGIVASVVDGYELMIVSWAFRFFGMLMVTQSVRMFRSFPVWPISAIAVFVAIVWIFFLYWVVIDDNLDLRTGVISLSMATLTADASWCMFRRVSRNDRLTHWSTGLVFTFAALFLLARGVANFLGSYRYATFSHVPAEIAATIAIGIAFIGASFGMLLASNARLRHAAEKSALFDPLTNLPNRRLFEDRLIQAEQRVLTSGRQIGIIYIDLDDFKLINDTRGHDAGDDLLKKVSGAMARVLRPSDCLARVGGDEFVVLVEELEHRNQLDWIAERLSTAIEAESEGGPAHAIRASYGVAVFPEDGTSPRDVMRLADAEMYHAKRQRRNLKPPRVAV